jgi:hypothetical protein
VKKKASYVFLPWHPSWVVVYNRYGGALKDGSGSGAGGSQPEVIK